MKILLETVCQKLKVHKLATQKSMSIKHIPFFKFIKKVINIFLISDYCEHIRQVFLV